MMERNNGKIIAIVALVVAVIGLSLGFAAFSTQLSIGTAANVSTGATGNWNVGFSKDGTGVISGTDTVGTNGTITISKYTISQATNATLNFNDTKSASYNFYIANDGSIPAYLDKVDFNGVTYTCTNAAATASSWFEGSSTAGAATTGGNTNNVSASDCADMFSVTLTVNTSNTYTTTQNGITGVSIPAGSAIPATLTIAYKDDAAARTASAKLDGDITVSIGTIVVDFKSTANTGN